MDTALHRHAAQVRRSDWWTWAGKRSLPGLTGFCPSSLSLPHIPFPMLPAVLKDTRRLRSVHAVQLLVVSLRLRQGRSSTRSKKVSFFCRHFGVGVRWRMRWNQYTLTQCRICNQTESMNLSLKELKERTEAERQKNVIAVRARHLLVEVRGRGGIRAWVEG